MVFRKLKFYVGLDNTVLVTAGTCASLPSCIATVLPRAEDFVRVSMALAAHTPTGLAHAALALIRAPPHGRLALSDRPCLRNTDAAAVVVHATSTSSWSP